MKRISGFVLSALLGIALLTPVAASADPVVAPAADTGAGFAPVGPVRVLDTRESNPVGPGSTVTVDLSAHIPATATTVVLNVTGTQPSADTWITVYPNGVARPYTSNLNLVTGETRPNLVTVGVGDGRKVVLYNQAGTVQLVADVTGYYAPEAPGKFMPVEDSYFEGVQFRPDTTRRLNLQGRVPASATAVTLNLNAFGATDLTFITVWPAGTPRPNASNMNITVGQGMANVVTVALGADQGLDVYNYVGDVYVHYSLVGFYTPEYGGTFTPVTPKRVLDTRDGTGGVTGPVNFRATVSLAQSVPANTFAVVLNAAGTQPAGSNLVRIHPYGTRDLVNYLELEAGQTTAAMAVPGVGRDSSVSFTLGGSAPLHLVADLTGYFTLPDVPCTGSCIQSWGTNEYGNLGSSVFGSWRRDPQRVYGLSNVKSMAYNFALKTDGTVWAWGMNMEGQLGVGWAGGYSPIPLAVSGLRDITAIDRYIALKADGTVWTWGAAPGRGHTPRQAAVGLTDVTAVAASDRGAAYALRADGTVWAWGSNQHGALGTGAPVDSYTEVPAQVSGLTGVRSIAAVSLGAYAVKNDGTVWSWGINNRGQLGNGAIGTSCGGFPPSPQCYSAVPVRVVNVTGVTSIGAGSGRAFAVRSDGTVWGWGDKSDGMLGNGEDCQQCATGTPVHVSALTNARAVHTERYGSYAVDADGRVWAWGRNYSDRLGPVEGTMPPSDGYTTVPMRLSKPTGATAVSGGSWASGSVLVP